MGPKLKITLGFARTCMLSAAFRSFRGGLFTEQPSQNNNSSSYHEPRQTLSAASSTPNLRQILSQTVFSMTTFEPSLSSSMRASHDVPSMADQLPSINFGFDDLRSRMNQFTTRFDAFIENGRRRVLEERNQFRMNVAELHGTPCTYYLR